MSERLARVRTHFRENKDRYAVGAICLGVGAAAACLLRKGNTQIISAEGDLGVLNAVSSNYKPTVTNHTFTTNITNNVKRLSYITKCLETEEVFRTQNEAAKSAGVDPVTMSRHIAGKLPNAGGQTFERLGVSV